MKLSILALTALLAVSGSASATITTYFGQDSNPGGTVPAGGGSETARNDFLSSLTGVGSEDFEGLTAGSTGPFAIDFAGSSGNITATLSGTNLDLRNSPSVGAFATSGSQYLQTTTNTSATAFNIDFSSPIAAFGFYATDLGDSGGGDVILTLTNGVVETLTVDVAGLSSGNLLFYGFISDAAQFSSISFANTAGSGDVWGFDDMVVGDIGQVTPPTPSVPVPTSLALLGLGLAGFGYQTRRKPKA